MQIFVTDFDFSPLRVASTFMRKCAKPQKKSWSEIAKKGASKEVGSVCLPMEKPVVGCEAETWVT